MNFLFVYVLPPSHYCYTKYNSGIASLSAVLKKKGHDTDMILVDRFEKKKLNEVINNFQPDIIGYSFVSKQKFLAQNIIHHVARHHKVPSIIGGVHATVDPEDCLEIEGPLGVLVGEGEFALLEFVNSYAENRDYSKTANFYFKNNGKIIRNPLNSLIQDLDSLPFPDRKIFKYNPMDAQLGLEFFFSRGCPYKCSYCINEYLQELYEGKGAYVRFRSPESVIEEIEKTIKMYDYDGMLTFHDDVFTLKKTWLGEFSELYRKRVALPYRCNSTAERIDRETADLLKISNCKEVWFGIETGFEELRKTVLNKKISDADIIKAGKTLNDVGISPCSFNMLGIPDETEENIRRLIEINIQADIKKADVGLLQPFPGTALYELCRERNNYNTHSAPVARLKGIKKLKVSDRTLYMYFFLFNKFIFRSKYLWILKLVHRLGSIQWLRRKMWELPPSFKRSIKFLFKESK